MRQAIVFGWFLGCGGSSNVYAPCDGPRDCVVPDGAEAQCLDKSGQGFCSWACEVDVDCSGDGPVDGYTFVCASFESEPGKSCFPACADDADEVEECPTGYGCRSTGGGNDNRKVCFPEGESTG